MTLPEQIVYLTAFATEHAAGRPTDATYAARCALSAAQNHGRSIGDPLMREALGLLPAEPPALKAARDNFEVIILAAITRAEKNFDHPHADTAILQIRNEIETAIGRPLRGG